MQPLLGFFLVFAVGAAGFLLFRLCRVPNPAMLGSMFATGALSITGHFPPFPVWSVSFAANLLIGVMIGRQMDRSVFSRMAQLARPVLIQLLGIIALSLICGYVLYAMGGGSITIGTALIGGAAGGITEMIVFGMSVGEDVAVIAFIQLTRVVVFLSLIPHIANLCRRFGPKEGEREKRIGSGRRFVRTFTRKDYARLAAAALAGSLAGVWLDIPSGGLIGAMLASGAFALIINKHYHFNVRLRHIAQIGLGLVLGQRLTPEMVEQLGRMFVPALAVTAVMLAGCTALALLLRASTGWDLTTCLLCSAPAGLSQITVYADEIGVDSFIASVFHTVRILGIVSVYPWIVLPLM